MFNFLLLILPVFSSILLVTTRLAGKCSNGWSFSRYWIFIFR